MKIPQRRIRLTASNCLYYAVKSNKNEDGTYYFILDGFLEKQYYTDRKGYEVVEYSNYGKKVLKFKLSQLISEDIV